jgi:hypothetical protein
VGDSWKHYDTLLSTSTVQYKPLWEKTVERLREDVTIGT